MAIILSDLDGNIAHWEPRFVDGFRRLHPDLPCADAGTRESFNMLTGDVEYDLAVIETMNEPGFYLDLDPIPGAVEAHRAMLDAGHDVLLCSTPTDANPTCTDDKREWVRRHLGEAWVKRLILTHDKTLVHGDVLFDDKDRITGLITPSWTQIHSPARYNLGQPGVRLPEAVDPANGLLIPDWSRWEAALDEALALRAVAA